jgi:hypothetical protein
MNLAIGFELRGATILSWDKGHKQALYHNNLKNFYNLRSSIVHGSIRKRALKLSSSEACSIGEDYLRRIWWWFFENGFAEEEEGLNKGTNKIDNRILNNLAPVDFKPRD